MHSHWVAFGQSISAYSSCIALIYCKIMQDMGKLVHKMLNSKLHLVHIGNDSQPMCIIMDAYQYSYNEMGRTFLMCSFIYSPNAILKSIFWINALTINHCGYNLCTVHSMCTAFMYTQEFQFKTRKVVFTNTNAPQGSPLLIIWPYPSK